jgi:predicted nucleic-acid-binding protein
MSLPLALDTNLLVRLLTNDDPRQARRVADLIDDSPACFVPITVVLEQEEQVLQALEAYGEGLDFADALHRLRSEGCAALVSFDQAFGRKASELVFTPAVQEL